MTGGGGSGGSRKRARKVGVAKGSEDKGGASSCDISFQTILASPNPDVAGKLIASAVLEVAIEKIALRGKAVSTLVAKKGKEIAGGIDDVQSTDVIACMGKGVAYKATVLRATGGEVLVSITKK